VIKRVNEKRDLNTGIEATSKSIFYLLYRKDEGLTIRKAKTSQFV
jgi:hypothetical protein